MPWERGCRRLKKQQQDYLNPCGDILQLKLEIFVSHQGRKKQQNESGHGIFFHFYCTRKLSLLFEILIN